MSATSGLSQYFENAIANWVRGTTFPAVPGTLYLALFTTAPVNGTDAAAVEVPATNGYARKSFTPNTTNFGAPSGAAPATMALAANQVFASPTGAGWGTIVGWAMYDAASAGNMICYGIFTGIPVASGDTVQFLVGTLTVTVS